MATTTTKTNKPILPRGVDNRPVDSYNRAELYSGKALDFDGVNDVIEFGGYTTFTGNFSFSMYIKTSTIAQRGLLCDTANNDGLLLYTTDEALAIRIDGTNYPWNTGLPIYNDHMNHLVVVRSGSEVTPYLNGVAGNSVTASSGTFSFNQFGRQTAAGNFFNGQASNIKAFNVALTAAQVADLYNNPEKVVPTGVADSALKLWLPMQEGAGATAYDGSGNGNHGTINGATWTHGIGAPVAQTAVIDWNKGTNLLPYSEEFNIWIQNDSSVTADDTTAPNGTTTADKWVINSGTPDADIRQTIASQVGKDYLLFVFVKANGFDRFQLDTSNSQFSDVNTEFNVTNGTIFSSGVDNVTQGIIDKGNGWYLCYIVGTAINTSGSFIIRNDIRGTQTGDGSKGMYLWGGGYVQASDITPYIPTIGNTTQTSPVLLPQGLTTGRDITGVNLFENVRKQGALNLDGNSWAAVHGNASLDITDAITLECWINSTDKDQYHHIVSKNEPGDANYAIITEVTTGYLGFEIIGGDFKKTDYNVMDGNWNHVVVTYDETNLKFYVNGVLDETIAYTSAIPTNSVDVYIGARPEGVQLYESDIAQPRIYNRALTAEEVKRNYEVSNRGLFGEQLLLNEYPGAAAAYSLRRLNNTYEGDVIVVRRASDNATQSIGFVNNELDTTSLESFCSGTDGFVTTWYDQSGNGNDATQTTAGSQPKIVSSGSTILDNGKASVSLDGGDYMVMSNNLSTFNNLSSSVVVNPSVYSGSSLNARIYNLKDGTNDIQLIRDGSTGLLSIGNSQRQSTSFGEGFNTAPTTQSLLFNVSPTSSINQYARNGNSIAITNSNINIGISGTQSTLFQRADIFSSTYYNGNAQEIVIWNSNQSSNRSGIETNINDHYSIY